MKSRIALKHLSRDEDVNQYIKAFAFYQNKSFELDEYGIPYKRNEFAMQRKDSCYNSYVECCERIGVKERHYLYYLFKKL